MIRLTVTKEELWAIIVALKLLNERHHSNNYIHDKLESELKSIYKEVS